ncbi:NUDIX domain-containing protein [Pseudorhodoplanes sp.]|uniref:NUDIX domain-containing protein n=1 Tax=Pseudorhodoplanes sp. TaxID=1934341 RepID=UPI003D0D091C
MIRPIMHLYWRFSRGLTLGVRGMALDSERRIFLIKHSYVPGWHLPGGGVEVGETMSEALRREMMEEGNIEILQPPRLFAIYHNRRISDRDHVALFLIDHFAQEVPPQPNAEIIAHGFFDRGALPDGTTPATRARIAEVLDGGAAGDLW